MQKFNKFRDKQLRTSHKIIGELSQFPTDYDAYIIGSDQVWNKKVFHHKVYKLYQGNFKRKSGSKLISYAASAGNGEELLANSEFCSLLNSYDAVSVREKTLQAFIQKTFNISPQLVIDPTLLVDKKLWLSKVSRKKTKPYLLIYLVLPK